MKRYRLRSSGTREGEGQIKAADLSRALKERLRMIPPQKLSSSADVSTKSPLAVVDFDWWSAEVLNSQTGCNRACSM